MAYWWCLEHKKVEEGLGCASTTRMGPYDSADRAASALDRVHARESDQNKRDEKEK